MRPIEDEPDYLAPAQLPHDPDSFVQVVKEAFQLEHNCVENQDIAAVLKLDKSRISQILKHPETLKAETIRNLLDHLKGERHKRRIVRAWIKESLDIDVLSPERGTQTGSKITEKILRRVDRQIRELRLTAAAVTSLDAARKSTDVALREQLLDRAYWTRQRLDLPGQAMAVVRMMAEGAKERHEPYRQAAADYFRARILIGLPDSTPQEIEPILKRMDSLMLAKPPKPAPPYMIARKEAVESFRFSARLTFIERGVLTANKRELSTMLEDVLLNSEKKELTYQGKFAKNLTAARIYLLLGETFSAQERVELAFKSGEMANLNALEMCGVVQARILKVIEPARKVSDYLSTVAQNCVVTEDRYHGRLAEFELARLESDMFPPSHPVL